MKIAVLSDAHDHIWSLRRAVEEAKANAQVVIFCGDMCAPFSAKILAETGLDTYICLGNNDGDQIGLVKSGGQKFHWVHLGQEFGEVELGGFKFAYCHYPKLAELLVNTGNYRAVFFGHTHQAQIKNVGESLLVNPGAICGIHNGEDGPASYAYFDTDSNNAEIIVIEEVHSKSEDEKQKAKVESMKLGLSKGLALTQEGMEVHAMDKNGQSSLLSKSENQETVWIDALKALQAQG